MGRGGVFVAMTKRGGRMGSKLALPRLVTRRGMRVPRCMAISVGRRFITSRSGRSAMLGRKSGMRFLCFVKNKYWVTVASRRVRHCSHRVVLGRINTGKRGGLLGKGMLVVNTNNLNTPTTVCLTTTNIKAVNVISTSRMSLSGLRERVVRDATSVKGTGMGSTGRAVGTVGPSIRMGACQVFMSTSGVHRLVQRCSFVVSKASGFPTGFLVGSTYMLRGGPFSRTNVVHFGNRLVACMPKRNPYCHYMFGGPPPGSTIPAYGRTNIVKTVKNIVNSLRTVRTVGCLVNMNSLLAKCLLAFSTLAVRFRGIGLPGSARSYTMYKSRPAVLRPVSCRRRIYRRATNQFTAESRRWVRRGPSTGRRGDVTVVEVESRLCSRVIGCTGRRLPRRTYKLLTKIRAKRKERVQGMCFLRGGSRTRSRFALSPESRVGTVESVHTGKLGPLKG